MAETIVYSQVALEVFRAHYASLRDKASYDSFLARAHGLIAKLGIEPYYVRLALTGKHFMLELGSRKHSSLKRCQMALRRELPMVPKGRLAIISGRSSIHVR